MKLTASKSQRRRLAGRYHHHAAGLSIVELLVALAITAVLLTATMVAIDASFKAYAIAAESASTQTATRMVTHRLLTLVRTSTAHGPLVPDADAALARWDSANETWIADATSNTLKSSYLELIDTQGNFIRIEYREDEKQLWLIMTPYGSTTAKEQPLLGGVTKCDFFTHRRMDNDGVLVLERGSVDMTVEPDEDNTLSLEVRASTPPIRVIASTKPRKLD